MKTTLWIFCVELIYAVYFFFLTRVGVVHDFNEKVAVAPPLFIFPYPDINVDLWALSFFKRNKK